MRHPLLLPLLCVPLLTQAQIVPSDGKTLKSHVRLGFVNSTCKQNDVGELSSNFGITASVGKTFSFHKTDRNKRADNSQQDIFQIQQARHQEYLQSLQEQATAKRRLIGDIIKFGIDATWCDLTYTDYKVKILRSAYTDEGHISEGELSVAVGPSVTVVPATDWNIHAYFQVAPSFSFYQAHGEFLANYATFLHLGGTLCYKAFGIGVEWRRGAAKYEPLVNLARFDKDWDKRKATVTGLRAYLTYNF